MSENHTDPVKPFGRVDFMRGPHDTNPNGLAARYKTGDLYTAAQLAEMQPEQIADLPHNAVKLMCSDELPAVVFGPIRIAASPKYYYVEPVNPPQPDHDGYFASGSYALPGFRVQEIVGHLLPLPLRGHSEISEAR